MPDYKQQKQITMDKKPTIYCGGGKKMNDNWMTVTVHIDKVKDHVFDYKGNKYLKLNNGNLVLIGNSITTAILRFSISSLFFFNKTKS